jgi:hypothetical protein
MGDSPGDVDRRRVASGVEERKAIGNGWCQHDCMVNDGST